MNRDALRTLFHPFESGDLPLPPADASVLFMGAEPGFRLPEGFPPRLMAVQGFRPDFLKLRASSYETVAVPPDATFDVTLVLCGRHRGENELRIADAIARTRPGGLIVVAGGKEDGVNSLRKRLENKEDELAEALGGHRVPPPIIEDRSGAMISAPERIYNPSKISVPLRGHIPKYHGMVFWLDRTPQAEAFATIVRNRYGDWPLIEGRFRTAPGMFSWDRVDRGSALLSEHLPSDLSGRVADFGAGWGYLSACLLDRCPAIASLHLYEADFASLEAAKTNLAHRGNASVAFHWLDLTTEPVPERFNAIVMNPPFHTGRAAEPSLGQKLIQVASRALVPKGRLLLVANTGLPYERTIASHFATQRELVRQDGFKVIEAVR